MLNGWLIPCIALAKQFDTMSLLNEYKKLLTFLGFKSKYLDLYRDIYHLMDQVQDPTNLDKVTGLVNEIPQFRKEEFIRSLKNHSPFILLHAFWKPKTHHIVPKPKIILYQGYDRPSLDLQLNIEFRFDRSVYILLWSMNAEKSSRDVEDKLNGFKFITDFKENVEHRGFEKIFSLEEYGTMKSIDRFVLDFVKELLEQLRRF